MDYDLVIRNGTVITASDIWEACDIGIKVRVTPYTFTTISWLLTFTALVSVELLLRSVLVSSIDWYARDRC